VHIHVYTLIAKRGIYLILWETFGVNYKGYNVHMKFKLFIWKLGYSNEGWAVQNDAVFTTHYIYYKVCQAKDM
jgi:hypothetical protein